MSQKSNIEKWPYLREMKIIVSLVLSLWGVLLIAAGAVWQWGKIESFGTFGDTFGVLNALFSGSAFIGIIYTVLLQREELKAQRIELRLTRDEMKGQREALENQNAAFLRQSFESTFFKLLELCASNSKVSVFYTDANTQLVGYQAFESSAEFIRKAKGIYQRYPNDYNTDIHAIFNVYGTASMSFKYGMAPFFKSISKLITYVNNNDTYDKEMYVGIVRSQLTPYEMLAIFYSCLIFGVTGGFKKVVEDCAFFKSFDTNLLISPAHMKLYSADAYGGEYPQDSTTAKTPESQT